jgi:hypothetical protein
VVGPAGLKQADVKTEIAEALGQDEPGDAAANHANVGLENRRRLLLV